MPVDINYIKAEGEAIGLVGNDLTKFILKEKELIQEGEREERLARRQTQQDQRKAEDREHELRLLSIERDEREQDKVREHELKLLAAQNASVQAPSGVVFAPPPKLPTFRDGDEIDAYLGRFVIFAKNYNWDPSTWGVNLGTLLTGKALTVYNRLSETDSKNFEIVRDALLVAYDLTEEGFRRKFRKAVAEKSETSVQFIARLESYFDRWVGTSGTEPTYDGLKNLILQEQFLNVCNPEVVQFVRQQPNKTGVEVAKLADLYRESQSYYNQSSKNISQSNLSLRKAPNQLTNVSSVRSSGPTSRPNSGPSSNYNRCWRCGLLGHRQTDCRVNFNKGRSQPVKSALAEIDNSKDSSQASVPIDSSVCLVSKSEHCSSGDSCCCVSREGIVTRCGRVMSVSCLSSVHQVVPSMPLAKGRVGKKLVTVLRDSGCSGIVVKTDLVKASEFTGEFRTCVLMDGTCRRAPVAEIFVETPYYSGLVTAVCMKSPVYDLIIGNIVGAREPSNPDVVISKPNTPGLDSGSGSAGGGMNPLDTLGHGVELAQAVQTRAQVKAQDKPVRPMIVPEFKTFSSPVTCDVLREAQVSDPSLKGACNDVESGRVSFTGSDNTACYIKQQGVLYREFRSPRVEQGREINQLVVPTKFRSEVLSLGHDSIMGGHLGSKKTLDKILTQFYWPGIHGDVARYCQSCDVCQRTTPRGNITKVPLGSMPLIDTPFKRVAVDLIGPIRPISGRGYQYILTLVDYATRYPEAVPLKRITSEVVAETLVGIYSRVGVPQEILSDMGTQFIAEIMKEVNRLLSVKQLVTSPYHPACNGLCERFNGTLKRMLKRMCSERPNDWDRFIGPLLFAYREAPQASMGFSPFELLYGRTVRGPMAILRELWTKDSVSDEVNTTYQYVVDLRERLEGTCKLAREELSKAQGRYKLYYDKKAKQRVFPIGGQVLLLLPTSNDKLLMQWQGPYTVKERVGTMDYRIEKNGKLKIYHANMLKHYESRKLEDSENSQTSGVMQLVCVGLIDGQDVEPWTDDPNYRDCELVDTAPTQGEETIADVHVCEGLNSEQMKTVKQLLQQYSKTITDKPGRSKVGCHDIKLTSDQPVKSRPYKLPFAMIDKVGIEIQKMLDMGIIEPSDSPYSSPIVLIQKKDKSLRFCVDYRKLNRITVFDSEPMPNPEELFAQLSRGKYFSKLDLTKGFWQVPLTTEAREKTAFLTSQGLYRFNYMPFGLVNSPASFSRMMRKVLEGMAGKLVNLIDDILIYSVTWEEHIETIQEVLARLEESGLTARPSKCYFGFPELEFLGHQVGGGELSTVLGKVQALVAAPRPVTVTQVRSFLGLAGYYRKFVPNFATIAAPLTDLTKKGLPKNVIWGEPQQRAFTSLKSALSVKPILKLPNFDKLFVIRSDASKCGLGTVLLQYYGDQAFPVAFASKKLLKREVNYSVIEKECMAIIWGIQKFQQYLYGREFVIETDAQPLLYLNRAKTDNPRLMRWAMFLQSLRYRIVAIKGTQNIGADYMSRILYTES